MPRIEATDRSISPLMMISVKGSAMMATSPEVTPVLKKFALVKNWGEVTAPKITIATTSRPRAVSQRSEAWAAVLRRRVNRSRSNAGTPSSQRSLQPQGDDPVQCDGHQQQEAGDGLQPQLRDAQHVQRRVDAAQQQGADGRTHCAAAAAEDGHPANHHRGDHGQLVAGPGGGVDGLVLRGPQHTGQAGDTAADREGSEDAPAGRDAGQPGRLRVRPDRVQLAAGAEG